MSSKGSTVALQAEDVIRLAEDLEALARRLRDMASAGFRMDPALRSSEARARWEATEPEEVEDIRGSDLTENRGTPGYISGLISKAIVFSVTSVTLPTHISGFILKTIVSSVGNVGVHKITGT